MTELRKQANRMMFNQAEDEFIDGAMGWAPAAAAAAETGWLDRQGSLICCLLPSACVRGSAERGGPGLAVREVASHYLLTTYQWPHPVLPLAGEDTIGLGVIGKEGSGRLRAVAMQQRQKLSAKAQKKVRAQGSCRVGGVA